MWKSLVLIGMAVLVGPSHPALAQDREHPLPDGWLAFPGKELANGPPRAFAVFWEIANLISDDVEVRALFTDDELAELDAKRALADPANLVPLKDREQIDWNAVLQSQFDRTNDRNRSTAESQHIENAFRDRLGILRVFSRFPVGKDHWVGPGATGGGGTSDR